MNKNRLGKGTVIALIIVFILLVFFMVFIRIRGKPPVTRICDNGFCESGENEINCPEDCEDIAPVDDCYLGMSLSSDFVAFSGDSPWRTPIEDNPLVYSNSAEMIQGIKDKLNPLGVGNNVQLSIAYDIYTAPVHVVNSDACPKVNIPSRSPLSRTLDANQDKIAENIPLPSQAWADPSDDSHLILVDPVKRISWEFWDFNRDSSGKATIGMGGKWDLNGLGYNVPGSADYFKGNGATGPKTAYIGGLLRYDEFASGEINHALNIITPNNRQKISNDVSWNFEYCSPIASRTEEGKNIGPNTIPEGARIQLNPDLDLDSLGLSEHTKIIARALQKYGAYVMDSGRGFGIKAQNLGADGGAWKNYQDIDVGKIPIDEFRVLECNIITANIN